MKTSKTRPGKEVELIRVAGIYPILLVMTTVLLVAGASLRASDPAVENVEDAAISTRVKTTLLYHLSFNFQVKTNAGVVSLSGIAVDLAEKNHNSELATEIKGVKNVVNNMVIPGVVARND